MPENENDYTQPMYCPNCDEEVPERWVQADEEWQCPNCGEPTYESKAGYIEVIHASARFHKENGWGPWNDGDEDEDLATDGGTDLDRPDGDVNGPDDWVGDEDDEFGYLPPGERDVLAQLIGADWRDHLTPTGANRLIETLQARRDEQPEPLEDGQDCPICGEPCRDASKIVAEHGGESIGAEKICLAESGDRFVVHLDDDRVADPAEVV